MGGSKDKEEYDKVQKAFQLIFDNNPFLEYKSKLWLEKPTLASEWKWYNFEKTNPMSKNHMDQRVMESVDGKTRWDRDVLLHGWTRTLWGLSGITSDLFLPIGDTATNPCVNLELNALECMEHYGVKRGKTLCMDYYEDFHECTYRNKQILRTFAMLQKRKERYREYLTGRRDYDSVYIPICKKGIYYDPAPNPKDKVGFDAF